MYFHVAICDYRCAHNICGDLSAYVIWENQCDITCKVNRVDIKYSKPTNLYYVFHSQQHIKYMSAPLCYNIISAWLVIMLKMHNDKHLLPNIEDIYFCGCLTSICMCLLCTSTSNGFKWYVIPCRIKGNVPKLQYQ